MLEVNMGDKKVSNLRSIRQFLTLIFLLWAPLRRRCLTSVRPNEPLFRNDLRVHYCNYRVNLPRCLGNYVGNDRQFVR